MFEEHEESPIERASDPVAAATEKAEGFRIHAQFAAVFEGTRKFDSCLEMDLRPNTARDIQQRMARLEKSKSPETPLLLDPAAPDAADLLNLWRTRDLSTNDYHIYPRPGEVMIVRWLEGGQVETFYQRLQAHFDAAIAGYREDQRHAHQWKQDPKTLAYLDALDKIDVRMDQRYLREPIRKFKAYVLSTQTADELNINYLADYIMGVAVSQIVGDISAPPPDPTDADLAWFFKLFCLRGIREDVEQMCFFTYLQKSDDLDF